jgi:hypothetical protein
MCTFKHGLCSELCVLRLIFMIYIQYSCAFITVVHSTADEPRYFQDCIRTAICGPSLIFREDITCKIRQKVSAYRDLLAFPGATKMYPTSLYLQVFRS